MHYVVVSPSTRGSDTIPLAILERSNLLRVLSGLRQSVISPFGLSSSLSLFPLSFSVNLTIFSFTFSKKFARYSFPFVDLTRSVADRNVLLSTDFRERFSELLKRYQLCAYTVL